MLRRRPSCEELIPVIQNAPLSLREDKIETHDISLAIQAPQDSQRELRFLVATASYTASSKRAETQTRIQRFASLTGERDSAVIFLTGSRAGPQLASPVHALNDFQLLLQQSGINLPLLPLPSASSLPAIITTFAKALTADVPSAPIPNTAMDILPYCTTDAPMCDRTVIAMTDLNACMRDLAALDERDVQRMLDAGMNKQEIDAVLSFWDEEWIAD